MNALKYYVEHGSTECPYGDHFITASGDRYLGAPAKYNDIPGDNIGIVSPIVSRGPVSPQFHYDDTLRQLPVQRSPTTQPSSVALLTAQAPSFAF